MRDHLLAAALVLPLLGGVAPASGATRDVVCRFADPAIVETSGLVVTGDGLFVTTNDSGDTGRVFVVDPASGRTVGVTHWSEHPVDVEALAPAGAGHVWVGDLGDNHAVRDAVTVTRVPVGPADRTVRPRSFELVYPGGPRDAETLMWDAGRRRLLVASKELLGATIFVAPRHLSPDHANRLRAVGSAPPMATDGAFFPDGRHFVVRGYLDATVYSTATLRPVATIALPDQRQGEGIAVSSDGEVYVSSEGQHSEVLRVPLPAAVHRGVAAPGPGATPGPSDDPAPSTSPPAGPPTIDGGPAVPSGRGTDPWSWLVGGLVGVAALVVLARSLRPR